MSIILRVVLAMRLGNHFAELADLRRLDVDALASQEAPYVWKKFRTRLEQRGQGGQEVLGCQSRTALVQSVDLLVQRRVAKGTLALWSHGCQGEMAFSALGRKGAK